MPRGPKKNASQHNNRHENGIVAPGRRITRQKSTEYLKETANANNTSSDGSSRADTPPAVSPLPSSPSSEQQQQHHLQQQQQQNQQQQPQLLPSPAPLSNGRPTSAAKLRSPSSPHPHSGSHSPLCDGKAEEMASSVGSRAEAGMRRSDSNVGRLAAQDVGPFRAAGTVLRSWPISDTLAVLVFLLSLPPALHSVINAVFTITTFVPPTGSFTMPTWSDLISSYSPAAPSLMVTILIDMAAMGLWVWLPGMFQALAIDSAQAIVATTLGGGNSNKPGSSDNTILCLAFTMLTHLASRYASRYKHTVMQIFHRSEIERWPPQNGTLDERPLSLDYPVGYDRSWFDTIKVFLAIHIVCQGLTKMVRRSLSTSRTTALSGFSGRNGDPEVTGPSLAAIDPAESNHHSIHQPQLRSRESLANLRDSNRDKISSGKRRRKQGNYTRSQQPLWASVAASKVSIIQGRTETKVKEDSRGTGAVDETELGDAPFECSKNNIWVTGIEPNSCFFETSTIESGWKPQRNDGEFGSERSTPFYVTVNGARWTSLKMEEIPTMEKPPGCWVGEIYGLSPACSYQVLFKSHTDGTVMHQEAIATPASPPSDRSVTTAVSPAPILRPSSPASPTATLKTSIASFESSITRIKEEQRKVRKEAKLTQQNLRREIEMLSEKISKQANNVQSLQAKQTRENQHIRQAEDAITTMAEELDTWKEIPDEELDEYRDRKNEFEAARNAHRDAKQQLVKSNQENVRAHHTLQADLHSTNQKNERLQARVTKLSAQLARLVNPEAPSPPSTVATTAGGVTTAGGATTAGSATTAGADATRSNSASSATRAQQRQDRRQKWDDQLEGRARMLQNVVLHYNHNVNQLRALENQMEAAAVQAEPVRPVTPEGDLPGTVPQPPSSTSNNRPLFDLPSRENFGTPDRFINSSSISNHFDPLTPSSASLHKTNSTGGHGKTKTHNSSFSAVRPRSTSIMSGNTIFQDLDDGSGNTEVTTFDPWASAHAIGQFKRRSGGSGLAREGSNGGSSGSGSPW